MGYQYLLWIKQSNSELEKRVVATLLTLLDGVDEALNEPSRVILLGATNRPNSLDDALRRPGRLDKEIEIGIVYFSTRIKANTQHSLYEGIPSAKDRLDILKTLLLSTSHALTPEAIETIAFSTHGYVGADLAALVCEAGLKALKRAVMQSESTDEEIKKVVIEQKDLESALTMIKPSAMREVSLCGCYTMNHK